MKEQCSSSSFSFFIQEKKESSGQGRAKATLKFEVENGPYEARAAHIHSIRINNLDETRYFQTRILF